MSLQLTTTMTTIFMIMLLQVTWLASAAAAPRSIVFVHGILSNAKEFDDMQGWIKKDFPEAQTHSLAAYAALDSLQPMWKQVDGFSHLLRPVLDSSPGGVKLICYSQGGVICRGLLSTIRHNVDTFIALSSPLAGQFGDTTYLEPFFHDIIKEEAYRLLYTKVGQDISIGNYWNDPHHQTEYLKVNQFLPVLNNLTYNPNATEFKANFLRLKNLVLVGGPQDQIIGPWQSSHFGFYDNKEVVQPMEKHVWYQNDAFGLRTLKEQGQLHMYTVPGVKHNHWPKNYTVYQHCIRPWLGALS